jgi:tetratricopeptide (TPR) repeat protein
MRIANPIYDAVFKFLMEDPEIAKGLLSVILGEEIETLEVKSQETASFTPVTGIGILRYDFRAIIKSESGEYKKILIELQKAKHLLDIMRFRRYLGENYRKADDYQENGITKTAPLDMITIYFLGFRLENVPYAVLKANNCYHDVLTGKKLLEAIQEPFVNLLDHESFFIQIPRLKPDMQTRLEQVLNIFSQENKTDDIHELDFKGQTHDSLIEKMVQRLKFAIADEDVQRQLEAEEEVENILLQKDRLLELRDKAIEEKDKTIEEKDKAIEEKDKAIEEKDKAIEEKDKAIEEKEKAIAILRQKLQESGFDPDLF